jgi:hypothetical protein
MVAHALTRIPKFHENHVTPTFGCPPEYPSENCNGMVFTAFNSKLINYIQVVLPKEEV